MPLLLTDLDDTLVSRRRFFAAWVRDYLRELGRPAGEVSWLVELDDDGELGRPAFFRAVIDRYDLAETEDTMSERYRRGYLSAFRCEEEVVAALGRARAAGFAIGIITNGDVPSQSAKVEAAGLAPHVDGCCISEAAGAWKPAPEVFRFAAAQCGASLEGAWMIGDNPIADIGGAAGCGMRSVWMRLGREWPAALEHKPTYEADTFSEAIDLVLADRQ